MRTMLPSGLLALSCLALQAPPVGAATHTVAVSDYQFTPAEVRVGPGDTVRWEWVEGSHTVTSGMNCRPSGEFDQPIDSSNRVFTFTFTRPGEHPYFCIPHCRIGMTGAVIVVPGAGAAPMSSAGGGTRWVAREGSDYRGAMRADWAPSAWWAPANAPGMYAPAPPRTPGYSWNQSPPWWGTSAPPRWQVRSVARNDCAACHGRAGMTYGYYPVPRQR